MKIKYAHSNELDTLSSPNVFYRLSLAYIDSAIMLCLEMNKKKFKQTYSRGNVILFLYYHSVELFLKALIFKNNLSDRLLKLNANKMHDLKSLNKILLNSSINIDIPFTYASINNNQLSIDDTDSNPTDQFFRYHINKHGKNFNITGAFSSILLIKNLRFFKKIILSFKNEFDTREKNYNYFIV